MRRYNFCDLDTQVLQNLNYAEIPNADAPTEPISLSRPNVCSGAVEAVFHDLEGRLVRQIEKSRAVVGCMAWLTNRPVLCALAGCEQVSILVQKEDFLRPDSKWSKPHLQFLYGVLNPLCRYDTGFIYSCAGDPTTDAIRCIGIAGNGQKKVSPRMHHKFLVFCDIEEREEYHRKLVPQSVWTGSFNATHNGTNSLENAVIISDPAIAQAYYHEWGILLGLSEPCNWESSWVCPEYRIGT